MTVSRARKPEDDLGDNDTVVSRGMEAVLHSWLLNYSLTLATTLVAGTQLATAQLPVAAGLRAELLLEERANPFAFHGYAVGLEPGEIYVAIGRQVLRLRDQELPELIHEFLVGNSAGLLMRPTGQADLFYSNFKTGVLHRRNMRSGAEVQLRIPNFTFDIAVSQDGEVFASANPDFLRQGARSGIYRVHAGGLPPEKLIDFDGPSGPIVFDARGSLYYATQSKVFPTPPGSVKILRFDQFLSLRAKRGDPGYATYDGKLPVKGVELVAALDGAFDLSFDDRGRMYVSDPTLGGIRRTFENSFELDPSPLLPPSGDFTVQLQYVRAAIGDFAAYQPDLGAQLLVSITTFDATRVWSIRPARPQLVSVSGTSTGPGTLSLEVSDLPARQPVILFASAAPPRADSILLELAGLPLWFSLDPRARLFSWQGETDANGRHRFDIPYAGGFDFELSFQALGVIDLPPFEGFLASTPSISIRLHP